MLRGAFLNPFEQFTRKPMSHVLQNKPQNESLALPEIARDTTGPELKLGYGLEDALRQFLRNKPALVDDVGNRRRGNSRALGDVMYG